MDTGVLSGIAQGIPAFLGAFDEERDRRRRGVLEDLNRRYVEAQLSDLQADVAEEQRLRTQAQELVSFTDPSTGQVVSVPRELVGSDLDRRVALLGLSTQVGERAYQDAPVDLTLGGRHYQGPRRGEGLFLQEVGTAADIETAAASRALQESQERRARDEARARLLEYLWPTQEPVSMEQYILEAASKDPTLLNPERGFFAKTGAINPALFRLGENLNRSRQGWGLLHGFERARALLSDQSLPSSERDWLQSEARNRMRSVVEEYPSGTPSGDVDMALLQEAAKYPEFDVGGGIPALIQRQSLPMLYGPPVPTPETEPPSPVYYDTLENLSRRAGRGLLWGAGAVHGQSIPQYPSAPPDTSRREALGLAPSGPEGLDPYYQEAFRRIDQRRFQR